MARFFLTGRGSLLPMLLILVSGASAHAAFRCDAHGKVTYSDVACDGGVLVSSSDLRGQATIKAEQDDASRRATTDRMQLQRFEESRKKIEHAERKERLHASTVASAKLRKCEMLEQRRKWAEEDVATASSRNTEKARRKARRIAEQYVLDCKA